MDVETIRISWGTIPGLSLNSINLDKGLLVIMHTHDTSHIDNDQV